MNQTNRGPSSKKQLRSFGLIVGTIFGAIGLWPWALHGETPRLWALALFGGLALMALFLPSGLRPVFKVWMIIGHVLGWVNTRIILAIGFYGLFTPMGIIMRVMGRDPMHRGFDPTATTYRVIKTPRTATHMERQY